MGLELGSRWQGPQAGKQASSVVERRLALLACLPWPWRERPLSAGRKGKATLGHTFRQRVRGLDYPWHTEADTRSSDEGSSAARGRDVSVGLVLACLPCGPACLEAKARCLRAFAMLAKLPREAQLSLKAAWLAWAAAIGKAHKQRALRLRHAGPLEQRASCWPHSLWP